MHVIDRRFYVYTSGPLMVGSSNDAKSLMHCSGLGRFSLLCGAAVAHVPVSVHLCGLQCGHNFG